MPPSGSESIISPESWVVIAREVECMLNMGLKGEPLAPHSLTLLLIDTGNLQRFTPALQNGVKHYLEALPPDAW